MKNLLLLIILFLLGNQAKSQTEFILRFDHLLDGKAFALNQEATSPSGTKYKLSRLQYYISGIKIIHDGNQEFLLNNTYLFVDVSKPSSKEFSLGLLSGINNIEKIIFAVGVDISSNHLDPASYSLDHPLAPKNPTMHWGWTSGYRFIAVEGKAARSTGQFIDNIAIHSVGDQNFISTPYNVSGSMENGKVYINMKAEYNFLFDGISLAGGNSTHGESGSAAELCVNASQKVFSPASPTSTKHTSNNDLSKVIYQSDRISINYSIPSVPDLLFQLYDLNGNIVEEAKTKTGDGTIIINSNILSGNYFYTFKTKSQTLTSGKLMIR